MYQPPGCVVVARTPRVAHEGGEPPLQVIVFDPTREISRRAEAMFTGAGPEIVSVGSLRPLAALLAGGTPDDILIVRVTRNHDRLPIPECLLNSRFFRPTFLLRHQPHQLRPEPPPPPPPPQT